MRFNSSIAFPRIVAAPTDVFFKVVQRRARAAKVLGVTIHIVEDDPGVSDSLVLLLRSLGHQAVAHPDAETFFRQEPPGAADTIIIDLMLPGISGAKVIRWLQRLASPPKIIAISGQPQSAIEAQLRGMSMPRLLRKPLTEENITHELD